MYIRIGRFGRWHLIFSDGQLKIHAKMFDIPFDRFFCIAAAIRDVVKTFCFHDSALIMIYIQDTPTQLIAFKGFKKRFKVSFTKTFGSLSLNEFKEYRT